MSDLSQDHAAPSRRIGAARLAIGLVAGLAVWGLQEAADQKVWPATTPPLTGALAMTVLAASFVLVGGLAALRVRTLAIWTSIVAVVYALLGWHDLTRGFADVQQPWPSPGLMAFGAAGLFIAHHLVAGADADRKVIARYPRYFDLAWKHGVQLALSAAFVGVFWIVLFLGGALFDLIGIDFVNDLLRKEWFAIPATAPMFAAAVHLTDIRVSLIRGIRTVALTLLSWLLPVLTLLGAAFLLALPFTGLEPLWKTRSAAGILLSSAAVLIVLINAAWQDGEPDGVAPLVLRLSTRLAAGLLGPLVGLAAYALWLRIGQYGLTPDRIAGAAACLVGAAYAVGYIAAAVRPGRWMRLIAPTNVTAAFLTLGVLLAIFTPLADPARLSVDSQMARLAEGKVTAARFDYDFLRWQSGRYGREALQMLARRGGEAGRRAKAALADADRWERPDQRDVADADVTVVWPAGRSLPPGFLDQAWAAEERRLCPVNEGRCEAVLIDLNRDGVDEVLVVTGLRGWLHARDAAGGWRPVREVWLNAAGDNDAVRDHLRQGRIAPAAPEWPDLSIGGRRYPLTPVQDPPAHIAEQPAGQQ